MFRNFANVSLGTFIFLFNSFCLPDYGLSLWNSDVTFDKQIFKSFEVGFSNALKKIVGAPISSSSHVTADLCNQLLLRHHVAFLQARYVKRILKTQNVLLKLSLTYIKAGHLMTSVANLFQNIYDSDFWSNDLQILKARISWVQRHEARRGICHFYGI